MSAPGVVFDDVWKRFRRGERHDTVRDLVTAVVKGALRGQANLKQDEFWAVRGVSFQVQPGEALGIIGANGAGKSTALKLLTRILRPTRGRCVIRGRFGALIEVAAGFHPDLTGRENIFLQGAIMGMKRTSIERKLDAIIDFAGIPAFIDTPVKRFSSGMNARLGFAIAAHLDPDVLLIDEVLAVGDMAFQAKCERRLKEFVSSGIAVVFVSHNMKAVADLCSHALLLHRGEVAKFGTTNEVISAYLADDALGTPDGDAVLSAEVVPLRSGPAVPDLLQLTPGTDVEIRMRLRFDAPSDEIVLGVNVWDPTRMVYVYQATSDTNGLPLIAGRPGEEHEFVFRMTLHLTQGLYDIQLNAYDRRRQAFAAPNRRYASVGIVEQRSLNGIANLDLTLVSATRVNEPAIKANAIGERIDR